MLYWIILIIIAFAVAFILGFTTGLDEGTRRGKHFSSMRIRCLEYDIQQLKSQNKEMYDALSAPAHPRVNHKSRK